MKVQSTALFLFLYGMAFNATAAELCNSYSQQATVNVNMESSISIPRDAANGTVLYESTSLPITNPTSYTCSASHLYGMENRRGDSKPTTDIFPIYNTGFSWQFSLGKDPIRGYGGIKNPAGYYNTGNSATFRLIKTGDISSNPEISAGVIGSLRVDSTRQLSIYIKSTTKIISQSCESPDIKVNMGEHDIGIFQEDGSYSPSTNFYIKLNNCPVGVKKVTYSLTTTPSSPAADSARGIVELNKSSTAKGIGLQILNKNQQPLALNQSYIFSEYSSAGGHFSIPLIARYIRIIPTGKYGPHDTGMRAGVANAEVSFVMSYL